MITEAKIREYEKKWGQDNPFCIWLRDIYPHFAESEIHALHSAFLYGSNLAYGKGNREPKEE